MELLSRRNIAIFGCILLVPMVVLIPSNFRDEQYELKSEAFFPTTSLLEARIATTLEVIDRKLLLLSDTIGTTTSVPELEAKEFTTFKRTTTSPKPVVSTTTSTVQRTISTVQPSTTTPELTPIVLPALVACSSTNTNLETQAFLNSLYWNCVSRYYAIDGAEGNQAGRATWATKIDSGELTKPQVIEAFLNSPEHSKCIISSVSCSFRRKAINIPAASYVDCETNDVLNSAAGKGPGIEFRVNYICDFIV